MLAAEPSCCCSLPSLCRSGKSSRLQMGASTTTTRPPTSPSGPTQRAPRAGPLLLQLRQLPAACRCCMLVHGSCWCMSLCMCIVRGVVSMRVGAPGSLQSTCYSARPPPESCRLCTEGIQSPHVPFLQGKSGSAIVPSTALSGTSEVRLMPSLHQVGNAGPITIPPLEAEQPRSC